MPVEQLAGEEVCNRFSEAANINPKGFFAARETTKSKLYLLRVATALKATVDYMATLTKPGNTIKSEQKDTTLDSIQVIKARYRKGVLTELIRNRLQKAKDNITLDVIQRILKSTNFIQHQQCRGMPGE